MRKKQKTKLSKQILRQHSVTLSSLLSTTSPAPALAASFESVTSSSTSSFSRLPWLSFKMTTGTGTGKADRSFAEQIKPSLAIATRLETGDLIVFRPVYQYVFVGLTPSNCCTALGYGHFAVYSSRHRGPGCI